MKLIGLSYKPTVERLTVIFIHFLLQHKEMITVSHDGGIPSLDRHVVKHAKRWWYLIHRNKKSKRRVQI